MKEIFKQSMISARFIVYGGNYYFENSAAREDCVIEIATKCVMNYHKFDQSRNFKTWSTRIARNYMIDRFRQTTIEVKFQKCKMVDFAGDDPYQQYEIKEKREFQAVFINKVVSKLRPHMQPVIMNWFLNELNSTELAKEVGIKPTSVRARIQRARWAFDREAKKMIK